MNNDILIDKNHSFYIDYILKENNAYKIATDEKFVSYIENIKNMKSQVFPIPKNLNAELRSYQVDGFNKLMNMKSNGFGMILADDMGLGKTIQIISLLLGGVGSDKPSLITCPSSLILNWKKELNNFAPTLKVLTLNQDGENRRVLFEEINSYDVIVTSYELLKRDSELYDGFEFENFILDEAQYIKNSNTQNFLTSKKVKSKTKIALTGTPIENSLSELWSIMDFVAPGYLSTYKSFNKKFEVPIVIEENSERLEVLKRLCEPFILRRLKVDVLKELPEKSEKFLYGDMSTKQKEIYDSNLLAIKEDILKDKDKYSSIKILSVLMKLRQIANDPSLLYDDYNGGSVKLEMAIDII